jgi:two-component system cell cycle response regulator DivK
MAGESILVVDDAPVNLKLADIVLRKEGYQVHTVSDAEEALRVLRNFHPQIMLVDIQLPGMDGLELTKRVRLDPRTQGLIVIAVTACAMKGDEEKALAAGCDGYITKPINTQTLGRQIRDFVDRQPGSEQAGLPGSDLPAAPVTQDAAPVVPQFPGGLSLSSLEMESLRRRFLEEGTLQSRQLLMDLRANFDLEQAGSLAHRWIGAAGALGYSAISSAARHIEELLNAPKVDAARLREALTELSLAFADPREGALDELPDSILQQISGKRVAMVGFASEEAERLCSVFEVLGGRPRLFETSESPVSESMRNCQAVLVHVRPETLESSWLDAKYPIGRDRALVFVGNRDCIMALDTAVQARADEFLIDGWQPEEAMMRVAFALSRASGPRSTPTAGPALGYTPASPLAKARVLIADDEPAIRGVLQASFQEHKIECKMASTGREALRLVEEFRPNVVVLDVNMPDMNGFEVLAAIRNANLPVRVLLLSARRHESDVVHGFDLGADDYVVKPFKALEVLVRLKRMLGK